MVLSEFESLLKRHPDSGVSLSDIAFCLNLERTYCSRAIRSVTGKTMSEWIREIRIERAKELLQDTQLSVTEIGFRVGYGDLTTFERNFHKLMGTSPFGFRRAVSGQISRNSGSGRVRLASSAGARLAASNTNAKPTITKVVTTPGETSRET